MNRPPEQPAPDEAPLVNPIASAEIAAAGTPDDPARAAVPDADEAERRRVAAVHATGLVGVEAGERIDRIARQASRSTGSPLALVSLIDEHGQWNPGVWGENAPRRVPRGFSMCSAAIESPGPFVVEDASKDPRWADIPGVATDPNVRFYAGQPIDDGEGNLIAVLCVIDVVPRKADPALLQSLADLAVWARHELLAGRLTATAHRQDVTGTPAGPDAAATPMDTADRGSATKDLPGTDPSVSGAADPTAAHDLAAAGRELIDRASADRLHELERLQSLVVSTTAHELRTPLTVLRVHADLLSMAAEELGPDERASLEAITRAVTRLQDVSDGLVADLRGSAGGAEEALRRWLQLDEGSERVRPAND